VEEVQPTLAETPGLDIGRYVRQLVARFGNAEIRDPLSRICEHASDRIPKWVVPVLSENARAGRPLHRGALVIAAWRGLLRQLAESGQSGRVRDRRREQLLASSVQRPRAFVRDRDLFGDMAENEEFRRAFEFAAENVESFGAAETVRQFSRMTPWTRW